MLHERSEHFSPVNGVLHAMITCIILCICIMLCHSNVKLGSTFHKQSGKLMTNKKKTSKYIIPSEWGSRCTDFCITSSCKTAESRVMVIHESSCCFPTWENPYNSVRSKSCNFHPLGGKTHLSFERESNLLRAGEKERDGEG